MIADYLASEYLMATGKQIVWNKINEMVNFFLWCLSIYKTKMFNNSAFESLFQNEINDFSNEFIYLSRSKSNQSFILGFCSR